MTITSKQLNDYLETLAYSPSHRDGEDECIMCKLIAPISQSEVVSVSQQHALDCVIAVITGDRKPLRTDIFCLCLGFALGYTHAQTEALESLNGKS